MADTIKIEDIEERVVLVGVSEQFRLCWRLKVFFSCVNLLILLQWNATVLAGWFVILLIR